MVSLNLNIPSFGPDSLVVRGYAAEGRDVVCRLFIPIQYSGPEFRTWKTVSEELGIECSNEVKWDQIAQAAAAQKKQRGIPGYGFVPPSYFTSLIKLLSQSFAASTPFTFVLWTGYAEYLLDTNPQSFFPIPPMYENFLGQGGYEAVSADLSWLEERTATGDQHAPVAFWSADHTFVFAGPIYADSSYITCTAEFYEELAAAGYEVMIIEPDLLLPTQGA